ncbi:YceI family protein [Alteromonas sediminis]|uniref:YceI family protein n=1 Tax=Alteromonas sediminis TaxID=2259342 RepID=A0A3N5YML6_9ALTE|nr:YceI family protein [Alteromonas sediminis]RPJ66681.1 YceI family protein [Alteromonas sediminis]
MRILALAACFFASCVSADWTLDSESASVHFISTKNSHIAETHTFNNVKGTLSGVDLSVSIPLSSVNTMIPIRDERMRTMLFDVANNPVASFTAQVDESLMALSVGESTTAEVSGKLAVSGVSVPTTFEVRVSRLSDNEINVATVKPSVLSASSFKLSEGIEALRNIAGLKVISEAVPLTFNVTFKK